MEPRAASFAAMGARWSVRVWDAMSESAFNALAAEAQGYCEAFEERYSRFRPTSWLRGLAGKTGVIAVAQDFMEMLDLYRRFYEVSGGACTPLLGDTLSDLGYDETYSLTERSTVRRPSAFTNVIRRVDDEHIHIVQPVAFDMGAMGKGFAVDRIASILDGHGIQRFLVDGSGDIVYRAAGEPIRAGLEHPDDPTKAIGVIELRDGAFCASSGNRRKWGRHHHIIDPVTLASPAHILATWVQAQSAAVADCAATTLFVAEPEPLMEAFGIEYCMLRDDYRVRHSVGFSAEFFTSA